MAWDNKEGVLSFFCETNLYTTNYQYYAVVADTNGATLTTANTNFCLGTIYECPNQSNGYLAVATALVVKGRADSAISNGAKVIPSANNPGMFKTASDSNQQVFGIALLKAAACASNDIISIFVSRQEVRLIII